MFKRATWGTGHFQVFATTALALLSLTLAFTSSTLARNAQDHADSAAGAKIRALSNQLLQLHGQLQQRVSRSAAAGVRSQAATVIAARAAALESLIQQDPRAALSFAFSPELLADMAAKFPQSASLLETNVTLTGQLQHWIADAPDLKSSQTYWRMTAGSNTYDLHFSGAEPSLKPGQLLKATGIVVGSEMAVLDAVPVARSGSSPALLVSERTPLPPIFPAMALAAILSFGFLLSAINLRRLREFFAFGKRYAMCALAVALILSYPGITYAQGSCSTTGVQNVAVLLVNVPNGSLPSGVTQAAMQDVFFATNTPGISLDGFLQAASYGQTSATGGVFGPFNLTGTYTSCSDVGGAVTNDAIAAAIASGVNLSGYTRVFIVFPDTLGCGWGGFASVGGCTLSTASGTFNATVAWLSAAYMTPRAQGVEFASHELGHNMGLLHSGTISTGTAQVLGSLSSPGTETDQGDYWSTMGEVALGLYPAPQKAEVLNWLGPTINYDVVQSSGTYSLQPLETIPAGLQALKVERGTGSNEWLWIEYRQPVGGYDSTLLGPQAFTGALIHYEDANTSLGHTYLPNFTPSDTTGNSPALAAGQTWTDPYSNLSLSVLSASSTALTLSINYGTTPCTSAAPTVTVSPLNPSIYPGQSASYSVSVTDNDSSGCSASAINLASSLPSGWTTSFSSYSLSLTPGHSASVTLSKGAPSGTLAGTYGVNLTASNSSFSGSGTANATVITPPAFAVTLSVSPTSALPPSTVSISASVTNGSSPASGASVTFTLTAPNGSRNTQTATAGTNGVATWNYRVSSKSAVGTYMVAAQAALGSGSGGKKNAASSTAQTATSNAISFTIQ